MYNLRVLSACTQGTFTQKRVAIIIEIDVFHSNILLTVGFEKLTFGQWMPVDVTFTTLVKLKVLENFSIRNFQGKGSDAMYYFRWECMYEGNLDTREGGNV